MLPIRVIKQNQFIKISFQCVFLNPHHTCMSMSMCNRFISSMPNIANQSPNQAKPLFCLLESTYSVHWALHSVNGKPCFAAIHFPSLSEAATHQSLLFFHTIFSFIANSTVAIRLYLPSSLYTLTKSFIKYSHGYRSLANFNDIFPISFEICTASSRFCLLILRWVSQFRCKKALNCGAFSFSANQKSLHFSLILIFIEREEKSFRTMRFLAVK